MSDPRPLTERLTAALPDEVLNDVNLTIAHGFAAYPQVRAVLIAALLPVVEEPPTEPFKITEVKFGPHPVAAPCAIEQRCMYPAPAEGPTPAPGDALGTIETTWRSAALRVGEMLLSVGPAGYYGMTADQWLWWALHAVKAAPPDDTLARVAPTCATCKWMGKNDDGNPSCDHADAPIDIYAIAHTDTTKFGCSLHEALRPDAPEVK